MIWDACFNFELKNMFLLHKHAAWWCFSDTELRRSSSGFDPFANAESVEFAGKSIVKLAMDPKRIEKTGKIILVCDLAKEYGFTDEDGDIHDLRSIGNLLNAKGHTWLSAVVPDFIRIPLSVMHLAGNKF